MGMNELTSHRRTPTTIITIKTVKSGIILIFKFASNLICSISASVI
jgi:hypothetical protein